MSFTHDALLYFFTAICPVLLFWNLKRQMIFLIPFNKHFETRGIGFLLLNLATNFEAPLSDSIDKFVVFHINV